MRRRLSILLNKHGISRRAQGPVGGGGATPTGPSKFTLTFDGATLGTDSSGQGNDFADLNTPATDVGNGGGLGLAIVQDASGMVVMENPHENFKGMGSANNWTGFHLTADIYLPAGTWGGSNNWFVVMACRGGVTNPGDPATWELSVRDDGSGNPVAFFGVVSSGAWSQIQDTVPIATDTWVTIEAACVFGPAFSATIYTRSAGGTWATAGASLPSDGGTAPDLFIGGLGGGVGGVQEGNGIIDNCAFDSYSASNPPPFP